MVCPWFRIRGTVVRTIAMTARFDHIAEVTLDELRIELMYPLDDDAERFFRAHDTQADLPLVPAVSWTAPVAGASSPEDSAAARTKTRVPGAARPGRAGT